MPITVPTRTSGSLGTTKSDATVVTNEPQQLAAAQYNVSADKLIEVINQGNAAIATARRYVVSTNAAHYSTIQDAIDQAVIDGLSDRAEIFVYPGTYTSTATITVPGNVTIKGSGKKATRLINNTTDLFQLTGAVTSIEDLTIEASTTATHFGIDCNNQNGVHVRSVDFLTNGGTGLGKFLRQSGATWTVLFLEDVIADYPGTSGFHTEIVNTAAPRFVDCIINNVFFDAFQLAGAGGNMQVTDCQDVRIRNSTIRGNAQCTGIDVVRTAGTPELDVRHCWIGGVPANGIGVGINVPALCAVNVYETFHAQSVWSPGTLIDHGVDNGIGSWTYTAGAAAAQGQFASTTATVGANQTLTVFHDANEGGRMRNALGGIPAGSSVILRATDDPSSMGTFNVTSATPNVTDVTLVLTNINNVGAITSWTGSKSWTLSVIP